MGVGGARPGAGRPRKYDDNGALIERPKPEITPRLPKKPMGGARTGAGRKVKRDKYGTPIQQAEAKIIGYLPEIVDAMITLALGVAVQVDEPNGPKIYTLPPNCKAGMYCINRILGMPREKIDLGGDAQVVPVVVIRGIDLEKLRKP